MREVPQGIISWGLNISKRNTGIRSSRVEICGSWAPQAGRIGQRCKFDVKTLRVPAFPVVRANTVRRSWANDDYYRLCSRVCNPSLRKIATKKKSRVTSVGCGTTCANPFPPHLAFGVPNASGCVILMVPRKTGSRNSGEPVSTAIWCGRADDRNSTAAYTGVLFGILRSTRA